jgi:phenylpropionate dioxygenase-like ring-hydroxylating dioxygenase large terminal subunit
MWVPIALSRDVPFGVTRAVVIDGEERVAWRAADGAVQVWEDRCPHRGMRLSLGFVRGKTLNCLYHGWTYEADSTCIRIPAHPDLKVPATIKARAFPANEAGGMIWTEVGEGSGRAVVRGATPVASLAIDAPAEWLLNRLGGERVVGRQLVVAEFEGMEFQIGWHAVDATKTMLHGTLRSPDDPRRALQVLRRLRDAADEAQAA